MMKLTTVWYKRTIQFWLFFIGFSIAMAFNVDSISIAKLLSKDKKARENMVQLAATINNSYKETLELKIDTATKDTVKTIVRFAGDSSAEQTYHRLMTDITEANKILGLGWDKNNLWCYKKCCKEKVDSLQMRIETIRTGTLKDSLNTPASIARKDSARKKITALQEEIKNAKKFTAGKLIGVFAQGNWWLRLLGWIITALAISLGAPFWFDLLNKIVRIRTGISAAETAQQKQETNRARLTPKG